MAERPWGFWTESKLDMLSAYLPALNRASAKASGTVYLDLFAGQAENVSRDTGEPIDGSLRRALQTMPPFTVIRGFELAQARARSLEEAYRAEFPNRDLVVHAGDVHDSLRPALADLAAYRWWPTFAFVDPDGVEARWELFEALSTHRAGPNKVELFLLLASAQFVRIVNQRLEGDELARAEQLLTDLYGSTEWQPILTARRANILDPEQCRDEFTNLMRWRLEYTLGYAHTHALRLTNVNGTPIYDMVFATDHPVGDKIMKSVYDAAAKKFPQMRMQARARRRDRLERESGNAGLFTHEALLDDRPLRPDETYQHIPPSPPYGSAE